MRKLGNIMDRFEREDAFDFEPADSRPRRIAGATTTAWANPGMIDGTRLRVPREADVTLSGSVISHAPSASVRRAADTVALSDGTRITFASAEQLAALETV